MINVTSIITLQNATIIHSNSSDSTTTSIPSTVLPSTVTSYNRSTTSAFPSTATLYNKIITPTFPSTVTTNIGVTTAVTNYTDKGNSFDFNLSTTTASTTRATEATISLTGTESEHKFHRTIWAQDEYGSYVPYDDQYANPTAIVLLNIFLVSFLMIVIGIAVYPAVKKYCDSSLFGRNNGDSENTRFWIEDNEDVVSVLSSGVPECSFALLNRNQGMAVLGDDSSSACSLEILTETAVRSERI